MSQFVEALYNEYKIRNNLDRVVDYIEDKLKVAANQVQAYLAFSKRLFRERSFKHAERMLETALRKHTSSAALHTEMGKLKYVKQEYAQAAEKFAQALKFAEVNRRETLYNLGLSCLLQNKLEDAKNHFQYLVL